MANGTPASFQEEKPASSAPASFRADTPTAPPAQPPAAPAAPQSDFDPLHPGQPRSARGAPPAHTDPVTPETPGAIEQRAGQKMAAGQAVNFGEAGNMLLMGGAHFIKDFLDPSLPVIRASDFSTPKPGEHPAQTLVRKYVMGPMEEQKAAAEAAGTKGDVPGVLAHSVGAGVPFAGPMAGTTFEQVRRAHTLSEYAGAGLFGLATAFAAKGMKEAAPDLAPGQPGVGDVARALTDREAIVGGSHQVLHNAAKSAQANLIKFQAKVGARVGQLVDSIGHDDIANSFGEDETGSIKTGPAFDALLEAQERIRPASGRDIAAMEPIEIEGEIPGKPIGKGKGAGPVAGAAQQLAKQGESMNFFEAKDLRSELDTVINKVGKRDAAILIAERENLTAQMGARAEELGRGPEFAAYNTLHSKMLDHLDGVFGDLMKANTGLEFFKTLTNRANKPGLDALNIDLGNFGMSPNFFKDLAGSHKAAFEVAKQSMGDIGMGGKMKAFTRHPVGAGIAALSVGSAMSGIPVLGMAGRFVGVLLAVAKMADLIDVAKASAEMRGQGGMPPAAGTFGEAAKVTPGEPGEAPPAPPAARPKPGQPRGGGGGGGGWASTEQGKSDLVDRLKKLEDAAAGKKFGSRSREELATKESSKAEQANALRVDNERLEAELRKGGGSKAEQRQAHDRIAQNHELINELEGEGEEESDDRMIE